MKRGVHGVLDRGVFVFVFTGQHCDEGHIAKDRLYRFAKGDGHRHNEIYHCTLGSHESEPSDCHVDL